MNKKLLIVGIVRDAERGLKKNIPIINALCSNFEDYKIYMYENDSTDKTKQILRQWKSEFSNNITIILNMANAAQTIPLKSEVKGINPFFSRKRIEKMVMLRNNYMSFINSLKWIPDYVMIVDMDVSSLNLKGILSSFESSIDWDAVCAFGYSLSPKFRWRYHDTYALTMWGDENNPQSEKKIKEYAEKLGNLKSSDDWIRVFSAFGGLAIYKYEAIKGLRYQVLENDDTRVEVKCEHYSLYKQMVERGYDKFYINPTMRLKYQNLTLSIIYNSLMRKLGLK